MIKPCFPALVACLLTPLAAQETAPIPEHFSDRAKELLADSIPLQESAHQVNVVYFLPSDLEPYPDYERRLSELLLYLQQYYGRQMTEHGYANRSFGLRRTENGNVKIIVIRGKEKQAVYADEEHEGWLKEAKEVEDYFNAHPELRGSRHTFFLSPVPAGTPIEKGNPGGWAFHGDGTNCYAIDYPEFELKHIGTDTREGKLLTLWYGGFAHELGHGLNLPHNDGTATEHKTKGTALMANGNYTFGSKPTYMTQASCDILDRSETFAPAGDKTEFYVDHGYAEMRRISLRFDGEALLFSAETYGVAHVNLYVQDPPFEINRDYDSVAFAATMGAPDKEEYRPVTARIPLAELKRLGITGKGPMALDILQVREDGSRSRLRLEFDASQLRSGERVVPQDMQMIEGY